MILAEAYAIGLQMAFYKNAGGPGSGVKGYNTASISMPQSKHVSVGTRKALLEHMPFAEGRINVADISHAGQRKFVPDKLQKVLANPRLVTERPIDVLKTKNEVAIADGHHRFLAAQKMGIKDLPARIFQSRKA